MIKYVRRRLRAYVRISGACETIKQSSCGATVTLLARTILDATINELELSKVSY